MTPAVDILVLNWNGRHDTFGCLESLERLDYAPTRVVVVDNGSTDGSVDAIRDRFPTVDVVATGRNLGYSGGNNVGLRWCLDRSPGAFMLLLNNDTVVDPSFVTHLVACATEHPEVGIFGPKICFQHDPERLWFAGSRWIEARSDFVHVGYGEPDDAKGNEFAATAYVSGCALLVRTDVLRTVGLLDERFFLLFEEADFCFRARRHGFPSAISGKAVVWHKVSSSMGANDSPLPVYFHARNRLLFGETHLALRPRTRLFLRVLCETLFPRLRSLEDQEAPVLKRLYWLLRKRELVIRADYRQAAYRARLLGLVDYLRRRFGDCPSEIRALASGLESGRRVRSATSH